MNKARSASVFAGILLASLMGATTASATECIPSPPVYGEVIITPGVPAVDAVEEVSHQEYIFERTVVVQEHVPGTPAVPAEIGTRIVTPEIPYSPAEYRTVIVEPAVPAQAEESYTRHQYNKQTRTVREKKHGQAELVSDWSWWAGNPPKWSKETPAVLESGLHGTWTEGPWTYTRTYRYVPTGVTEKVVTKEAVPGKDAVTKQELVKAEQPYVPAVTEEYEITPAIPAVPEVPEVTKVERTDWVREAPVGAGWEVVDERKVVDIEAVEGKPAVDPITDTVITTPEVTCPVIPDPEEEPSTPTTKTPKPQPQPSSTPSAPTSVVPVKAASKPSAPQARASTRPESGLAHTGAEVGTLAVAGGLLGLGGILVAARRRRTN